MDRGKVPKRLEAERAFSLFQVASRFADPFCLLRAAEILVHRPAPRPESLGPEEAADAKVTGLLSSPQGEQDEHPFTCDFSPLC